MAVKTRAVTVADTATRLDTINESDDRQGSAIAVFNNSAQTVYVGGADVTTANGVPVPAGQWGPSIDVTVDEKLFGIVAATTAEVRVLETGV